jgi:DNA polymerase-3 subunit alpha (Gram-positive type)
MGDSILVAHNTSFDIPFFNSVLLRLNRPVLANKSICTNLMTRYLIPNLLNTNLNYMSRIFGIKHRKAHRALDDAFATSELLIRYLNIFKQKKIKKLNHLYYPRNKFELDRIHFKKDEFTIDEILETLKSQKASFVISLKGENGIIDFSMPGNSNYLNEEIIRKHLSSDKWNIGTIRIFGSLMEAILNFSIIFSKVEQNRRKLILTELENIFLNERRKFANEADVDKVLSEELGEFIIAHHIVPDQLVAISLKAFSSKHQLIFRYPGHQKKLVQYMSSKSFKIANNKIKKVSLNTSFKYFLANFLLQVSQNNTPFLKISKADISKKPELIIEMLDKYLKDVPNQNNYPKEYIKFSRLS